MLRNQPKYVAPQVNIGHWRKDNHWYVAMVVDHVGNITRLEVTHHHGTGKLDDTVHLEVEVEPFEDLLRQVAKACIDCAGMGSQLSIPGL